jgi:AbrB family looped-hinge helix DNA binding protein
MSGTFDVVMGDRGRLVVPAELRRDVGWTEGRRLHFIQTDAGVVVMTRDQLKDFVRRDLQGLNLVEELLAERRADVDA